MNGRCIINANEDIEPTLLCKHVHHILLPYNIAISAWNAMTVDTINQLSAQHAHTGSLILATSYMHVLANQKTIHEDKSLNATYRFVVTVEGRH